MRTQQAVVIICERRCARTYAACGRTRLDYHIIKHVIHVVLGHRDHLSVSACEQRQRQHRAMLRPYRRHGAASSPSGRFAASLARSQGWVGGLPAVPAVCVRRPPDSGRRARKCAMWLQRVSKESQVKRRNTPKVVAFWASGAARPLLICGRIRRALARPGAIFGRRHARGRGQAAHRAQKGLRQI